MGPAVHLSQIPRRGVVKFHAPPRDSVRDLVTDPPVNWRAIFNGPSGTPCRRVAIGHTAARRSARSAEVGGSGGWISASVPEGRLTIARRFNPGSEVRDGTASRQGRLNRSKEPYYIDFDPKFVGMTFLPIETRHPLDCKSASHFSIPAGPV